MVSKKGLRVYHGEVCVVCRAQRLHLRAGYQESVILNPYNRLLCEGLVLPETWEFNLQAYQPGNSTCRLVILMSPGGIRQS